MSEPAPLFIVGTERSGSNLLRLLLHAHPRIAIPHPPHILRYFSPLEASYGDLSDDARFAALVDDVLALLDTHIHPWGVPLDRDRLLREARPRDLYGVYSHLYQQYAETKGKPRWGCKSTFMLDEIPRILAHHPRAQFLFLVRDPRDVAVSSRKAVFSTTAPLHTARLWLTHQRLGLEWEQRLPPSQWLRLRYEDLLASPEAQLQRVCGFLGEEFHPQMLRHFEQDDARQIGALSESWAKAAQPIQADNTGRWRGALSPRERLHVEGVAWTVMERLGYPPSLPQDALASFRVRLPDAAYTALQGKWWDLQIELRSLQKDANVWRRYRRALLLRRLARRRVGRR